MRILFVDGEATSEHHTVEDLRALVERRDGFVWVDIPVCGPDIADVLSDVFGFHSRDIKSCMERNHVSKVHSYSDYLFFVLFSPMQGELGHVHFLELDQFIGDRFLVTFHAFNRKVAPDDATIEATFVYHRIKSGELLPRSPWNISCEIVKNITMRMEDFIENSSRLVWVLQQGVTAAADSADSSRLIQPLMTETAGSVNRPAVDVDSMCSSQSLPDLSFGRSRSDKSRYRNSEPFLELLFRTRHGLLTVRSMAALSEEIYGRLMVLPDHEPVEPMPLLDVAKRFKLLEASAKTQQDYLQGVIDHYRARTDTRRTLAAISLTVIAVVTLPITALASIYGMNIINNRQSDARHITAVLTVMAATCTALLLWAKRRGWFRW